MRSCAAVGLSLECPRSQTCFQTTHPSQSFDFMAHNRPFMGTQLKTRQGVGAGLVAGAGMIFFWALFAQIFGPGADTLINPIAATVLGKDVIASGWQPLPLIVGLAIHFVIAILLGLLYAVSMDRLPRKETLLVSTFYGLTIWIVSSFIVAGWFNDAIEALSRTWWGFLSFLFYGFLLGVYASRFGEPAPTVAPD